MKEQLLSIFKNKKIESEVLNPESYSESIAKIENILLPLIESGFSNFGRPIIEFVHTLLVHKWMLFR